MLHILLLILKIIGIVIAALIGLLLLLVLIVLLVPIRYKAKVKKEEAFTADASINWLLGVLHLRVHYIKDDLSIKLRILGYPFWDNKKEKKRKREKKKTDIKEDVSDEKVLNDREAVTKSEALETKEVSKDAVDVIEDIKEGESETDAANKSDKKIILRKIFVFVKKIKNKIRSIFTTIRSLLDKKNRIMAFLKDEINKAGIKSALASVSSLIRYIRPKKVKGYIRFGTGDPCSTGQLLGAISMFYGYYGNSLQITSDFNEKILETEVLIKGRIRLIRLLIIALKLKRDDNFNKLIKNIKRLKEEM